MYGVPEVSYWTAKGPNVGLVADYGYIGARRLEQLLL